MAHSTKRCPNPECGAKMDADRLTYICLEWMKNQEFEDYQDVWKCRNCWMVLPRKRHKRHVDVVTPTQKKTVEQFKAAFFKTWSLGSPEKYEFKTTELTGEKLTGGGAVDLYIVVGRKGDEGTYGEVFARNKAHVFIGRKGSVMTYVHPKGVVGGVKLTGFHDCIFSEVKERELGKEETKA